MDRVSISGVTFDSRPLPDAVSFAAGRIRDKLPCTVITPNAEIAYACRKDRALREMVNRADLVLPDGIGVIYAAKILKKPLSARVAGIDFAAAVALKLAECDYSLFLLGAAPGVAEKAASALAGRFPGLQIAGVQDGYFTDEQAVIEGINQSGAQAVFVCLGFPKQEKFMAAHRDQIRAPLMVGLGGSLDVFAGSVRRAPDWMIGLGLEWLYRLIKNPSRIGRMVRLPLFIGGILYDKISGKDGGPC